MRPLTTLNSARFTTTAISPDTGKTPENVAAPFAFFGKDKPQNKKQNLHSEQIIRKVELEGKDAAVLTSS